MQKNFNGIRRYLTNFRLYASVLTFFNFSVVFCQTISQQINKIHTVILDAGHGGKDSGALGEKSQEKDLALAICLKAGNYIQEKMPDVKVVYTRTTDVFVPLYERAKIANDNDADLFISIHINSSPNPAATGTESLVLGLHRSNENFEVAKRENQVILLEDNYKVNYEGFDPNSEESYIMFSLMQYVYDENSISFANDVQNQFRERVGRKDRGVRRQGLLVLAQSAMPGVLIEAGFISNKDEEQYLMSDEGQDYLASAIFRAFRDYKQVIEGTSSGLTAQTNFNSAVTKNDSLKSDSNNAGKNQESHVDQTIKNSFASANPDTLFKVQILFSENKIDKSSNIFKDFKDIEEINVDGKYKYVVGSKIKYSEAVDYSKIIKNRFPGAFIVAVCNGKIIPLSEVLKNKQN
jgi:N-acetylmuramoyl-L-alanine amidase